MHFRWIVSNSLFHVGIPRKPSPTQWLVETNCWPLTYWSEPGSKLFYYVLIGLKKLILCGPCYQSTISSSLFSTSQPVVLQNYNAWGIVNNKVKVCRINSWTLPQDLFFKLLYTLSVLKLLYLNLMSALLHHTLLRSGAFWKEDGRRIRRGW